MQMTDDDQPPDEDDLNVPPPDLERVQDLVRADQAPVGDEPARGVAPAASRCRRRRGTWFSSKTCGSVIMVR